MSSGGSKLKGNPKEGRPIATKQAMHLVIRATAARGMHSFLRHDRRIQEILEKQAAQFNVRLYDVANAGNHLHIIVRVPSPRAYRRYIRAITGLIARKVLGAERGKPARGGTQFWDARPFTRIVSWGKDYSGLKNYLEINRMEIEGFERVESRFILEKIRQWERRAKLQPTGFEN